MPTTPVTVDGASPAAPEPVDEAAHVGKRDVSDGPTAERRDDVRKTGVGKRGRSGDGCSEQRLASRGAGRRYGTGGL